MDFEGIFGVFCSFIWPQHTEVFLFCVFIYRVPISEDVGHAIEIMNALTLIKIQQRHNSYEKREFTKGGLSISPILPDMKTSYINMAFDNCYE